MCHNQNPPNNEFCSQCGSPVTVEAMRTREELESARERRIAKMVLDQLIKEGEERGA